MKQKDNFLDELKWRGLLYQATEGAEKIFAKPITFYWGNDLTADSLHVGHLLGLIVMKRAMKFGHGPIILTASGTSMVGDPSGKEKERPIMSREEIEKNKAGIKKQIEKILEGEKFELKDNHDWLSKVGLLEFLRDAGKFITLNSMLDKESVKTRLERESGISFAEFTYQLLQAYDFLYLFEEHACVAQVAGSDQWGNMVQGVDLIRKKLSKQACALSWPLVEDPETGKKFGKSAVGKTIWLDAKKTHPFEFYQFFVNTEDSLAPKLIRFYSMRTEGEIGEIENEWKKQPETRLLQKELAFEITTIVHGEEIAKEVKKISEILYEKTKQEELGLKDLEFVKVALPYAKEKKRPEEFSLLEGLMLTGLVSSMSEAKRLVEQNGATGKIIFEKFFWIKKGKKDYGVVEFEWK
ncbi:MAG: tyrosine--tRNA ligase [Candidatus Brennerbacteria bacterium RIFOXYC1_FULL_41_11]|uniref:Tyrosine--tRNA ligase n=1 Tax=Candidatus Brennerbacteria bacterium RIFOXYD1_FULL_41_16 TaxID=1797529 RepID=A0A1G1XL46_9BACT|nr:MAG: tyrosine--tRNA ligase [Candidatus Brennerbacteria bacterium RIFOXYB1_FULL_41_13]OGY40118.1 MAG: tyrosine--tRNA ligase [Candidatus Brennerbacteria bacterium RIFOXYC1_FULL_41_11]OGY40682.1 MAG: tyrosine--tRNA ligase [Candidatus Brennerbacteria bacterium RIFOXYD1_FULL_41_16]